MHLTYSAGIGALIFGDFLDYIYMRASINIYRDLEICYSMEIYISIGLYQIGLLGIPMYSMAKAKYNMLNTN